MFDESIADLFWLKVKKSSQPHGCWFRGSERNLDKFYGTFGYKNGVYISHIVAYELTYGPVPDDLIVRHLCGHKGCCNPTHLEAGTQYENYLDMRFHQEHGFGVLAPRRYD